MKILVLGGDGYLGWPTAMHFSKLGHEVSVVDNFNKRKWENEMGIEPLFPIKTLHERIRLWREISGKDIKLFVGDLTQIRFVNKVFDETTPDAIIHYGEQPSAPFSMGGNVQAVDTQVNNVVGTLNVLFAMKKYCPESHLVKLGTMGEYGTPDIDIEEGYITIEHNGRKDNFLYPKTPGSFYHLSKVHDSHNIHFACRIWGLRATDLNQGVVYGIDTDTTKLHPGLATSFHYDAVFGTALNRFCVQAVGGLPITPYGTGNQKRGFLNLIDTIQCVELAVMNPAAKGEMRVYNQFTETFTINELAQIVKTTAEQKGIAAQIMNIENPRKEKEEHYYNPIHTKLLELGLKPHLLSDTLINSILDKISEAKENINKNTLMPTLLWEQKST